LEIASIGDHFVKNEIIQHVFEQCFPPHFKLQWRFHTVNSPEDPPQKGKGVEEYVGSEEDVVNVAKNAKVLVTNVAPVTSWVIQNCPQLRAIACCRTGPVNVDVEAATRALIPVFYAPGRNAVAVAEFTVGLILCLIKRTVQAHLRLSRGEWCTHLFYRYDNAAEEVNKKKVGIIGFGNIGQRVCGILLAFGAQVFVYDPYVNPEVIYKLGATPSKLDSLLKKSDIVTLHARATKETCPLIGPREFSLMKKTAYFINTARGFLVDYDALYEALKNGRIAGAAVDTYEAEPPPLNHPLLKMENVLSTPHIGGSSRQTAWRGVKIVARGVLNYFQSGELTNCLNAEALKRNSGKSLGKLP